MARAFLMLAACSFLVVLAGCSGAKTEGQAPKDQIVSIDQYRAMGEVLSLDPAAQTAKIKAEKIPGWMEAMTMDFPVKDKHEFEKLKVGEKIQANVTVKGTDYWLSEIAEAPTK